MGEGAMVALAICALAALGSCAEGTPGSSPGGIRVSEVGGERSSVHVRLARAPHQDHHCEGADAYASPARRGEGGDGLVLCLPRSAGAPIRAHVWVRERDRGGIAAVSQWWEATVDVTGIEVERDGAGTPVRAHARDVRVELGHRAHPFSFTGIQGPITVELTGTAELTDAAGSLPRR